MKPVEWLGNSRKDLRQFPSEVRYVLGKELLRVQEGLMPRDFKPMPDIGNGVYEIRTRLNGAWRMIYVARSERAIYVLHTFQKKTRQTAPIDIDTAKRHYRMIGG